ncbi:hypothetical protein ASD53_03560 [Lysobacter sp. Root559]|uniref:hypothetical protein n=1 Tax=Lysobacter sp. Root559 TaxID=1736559 RepID=UPI0007021028|nr:hypothetical protein [Lysobacter sp. Root559]KQZ60242.1 hypothetical protein ASD53_03560 [Lysobacter sp. Root559]
MSDETRPRELAVEPARHRDTGLGLWSFAQRVEVRCKRCDRPGAVTASWVERRWTTRYVCTHCGLEARSERHDWLGPVRLWGRRPCGYCGHQWLHVNERRDDEAGSAQVPDLYSSPGFGRLARTCPICGRSSMVEVSAQRLHVADGRDPHFGLPLRLIETTSAGPLWVYNRAHLEELRRYVGAQQRERRVLANRSMISRLPTWIKLARNRGYVLRMLDRLQLRLSISDEA